ncbi:hypothetical protein C8Q74DRAFT_1215876 [Fomes fomentarius]|nr:hypothetical protein C8Q74DRAFT_1215876 [Fomes fomentarius]
MLEAYHIATLQRGNEAAGIVCKIGSDRDEQQALGRGVYLKGEGEREGRRGERGNGEEGGGEAARSAIRDPRSAGTGSAPRVSGGRWKVEGGKRKEEGEGGARMKSRFEKEKKKEKTRAIEGKQKQKERGTGKGGHTRETTESEGAGGGGGGGGGEGEGKLELKTSRAKPNAQSPPKPEPEERVEKGKGRRETETRGGRRQRLVKEEECAHDDKGSTDSRKTREGTGGPEALDGDGDGGMTRETGTQNGIRRGAGRQAMGHVQEQHKGRTAVGTGPRQGVNGTYGNTKEHGTQTQDSGRQTLVVVVVAAAAVVTVGTWYTTE